VFFRFSAGLLLVVLVSMSSIWLEKQTMELRRLTSVQYYQTDLLLELLVRLRLESQQLTAPSEFAQVVPANGRGAKGRQSATGKSSVQRETPSTPPSAPLPLLRLQQPFHPKGID
jgi:hypothetical protein